MNLALVLGLASAAILFSAVFVSIAYLKKLFHGRSSENPHDLERGAAKPRMANELECTGEAGKVLERRAVRQFGWEEIELLTDNFALASVIGEGGFSRVYLARLPPDSSPAAFKLHCGGQRVHRAFLQEIDVLVRFHHPHIVRLLGFCDDREEEGVLVFEYVPNGSLHDNLHGIGAGLSWPQRMRIAFGLAGALDYLHEGCDPQIVHGDVTTSNVLLDAQLEPKLCDFGSARVGFSAAVSLPGRAPVVGSPGYADPHYLRTGLVSRKSDVYGFGVVTLELITGNEAFDAAGPALAARVAPMIQEKSIAKLVDPRLGGEYDAAEAAAMAELASLCVGEQPSLRPSMSDVLHVMRDKVPSAISAVN